MSAVQQSEKQRDLREALAQFSRAPHLYAETWPRALERAHAADCGRIAAAIDLGCDALRRELTHLVMRIDTLNGRLKVDRLGGPPAIDGAPAVVIEDAIIAYRAMEKALLEALAA